MRTLAALAALTIAAASCSGGTTVLDASAAQTTTPVRTPRPWIAT